jgi:hypothetical protein
MKRKALRKEQRRGNKKKRKGEVTNPEEEQTESCVHPFVESLESCSYEHLLSIKHKASELVKRHRESIIRSMSNFSLIRLFVLLFSSPVLFPLPLTSPFLSSRLSSPFQTFSNKLRILQPLTLSPGVPEEVWALVFNFASYFTPNASSTYLMLGCVSKSWKRVADEMLVSGFHSWEYPLSDASLKIVARKSVTPLQSLILSPTDSVTTGLSHLTSLTSLRANNFSMPSIIQHLTNLRSLQLTAPVYTAFPSQYSADNLGYLAKLETVDYRPSGACLPFGFPFMTNRFDNFHRFLCWLPKLTALKTHPYPNLCELDFLSSLKISPYPGPLPSLAFLGFTNLTSLSVGDARVILDPEVLFQLPALTKLSLRNLRQHVPFGNCPNFKILKIQGMHELLDSDIAGLSNLTKLVAVQCAILSDYGIRTLTNLEELVVKDTQATRNIRKHLPKLRACKIFERREYSCYSYFDVEGKRFDFFEDVDSEETFKWPTAT